MSDEINTQVGDDVEYLAKTFGLEFGPRTDREAVLDLIDQVVVRVERVLAAIEEEKQAKESGRLAFERFMAKLRSPLEAAAGRVDVQTNVAWIKIESRVNGHKVYIGKGKLHVNRVDSTLPAEMILGARRAPEGNGRIVSWLPADEKIVAEAIGLLADHRVVPLKK